jgi:hypothetical protein
MGECANRLTTRQSPAGSKDPILGLRSKAAVSILPAPFPSNGISRKCSRGGIGRRVRLRTVWGNPWRFESSREHHPAKLCGWTPILDRRSVPPPSRKPTGCIRPKHPANLVAHPPKHRELLLARTLRMRRILKPPVMPLHLPREHRTNLVGVSADRNYRFNGTIQKLVQMLAAVTRNIDAHLSHNLDRQRMHVTRRLRSSRRHLQCFPHCSR